MELMPLYQYLCSRCRECFDLLVGMTADSPDARCPTCGSEHPIKQVTRFYTSCGSREGSSVSRIAAGSADSENAHAWTRQLERELGTDLGADFDEYLDAADQDGEG